MSEAGERLIEAAKEAVTIASGEAAAHRIHVNGHSYAPVSELAAKDAIIAELVEALAAALDRMEGEYGMAGEHMDKGYAALSKAKA